MELSGQIALVCGASRGIGRAVAEELARLGATVHLLARDMDLLEKVKEGLERPCGQEHGCLSVDLGNSTALQKQVQDYVSKIGPVGILVNNSGGPSPGPLFAAKLEDFQSAFQQHVLGSHIMLQAVVEGMKEKGYGRVINIISTSVKQPLPGLGVSNTIRGAVANWAKTLAGELAPYGITVNNVLPGATETDRLQTLFQKKADRLGVSFEDVSEDVRKNIPLGRFGKADELAHVVAFLAGPKASYITGINVPVDGGRTASL